MVKINNNDAVKSRT